MGKRPNSDLWPEVLDRVGRQSASGVAQYVKAATGWDDKRAGDYVETARKHFGVRYHAARFRRQGRIAVVCVCAGFVLSVFVLALQRSLPGILAVPPGFIMVGGVYFYLRSAASLRRCRLMAQKLPPPPK